MSIFRLLRDAFASKRRLRGFTIGVAIAFVISLALACVFGVAYYCRKLQQRRLVAEITRVDGEVHYNYEYDQDGRCLTGRHPAAPAWLRRIVGDDFFGDPVEVVVFPQMSQDLLPVIGQLKTLRRVNVCDVDISPEPFKAVSQLSSLEELEFQGSAVPHRGLKDLGAISQMPTLMLLRLESMYVSDTDCELIVKKFPSLHEINVREAYFKVLQEPSDKGLAAIRKLPHLGTVRFQSQGLSYSGIAIFSGSPALTRLSLAVGRDAEGVVRLHDCPALEKLEISQFEGAGKPWTLLVERVPKLREVGVAYVNKLRLEDASRIEKLTLYHCTAPVSELLALVARCQHLDEADFDDMEADMSPLLKQLVGIAPLRKLSLAGTTITDATAKQLRSLGQLRELDLSWSQVDDDFLQQLEDLANLRSLSLFNTNVTDEGVKRIEKAIPGLHCVRVNPTGLVNPIIGLKGPVSN